MSEPNPLRTALEQVAALLDEGHWEYVTTADEPDGIMKMLRLNLRARRVCAEALRVTEKANNAPQA